MADSEDDAEDLPIGTEITEPGIYGKSVKYAPDRWARTAFDNNDALINLILKRPGVEVKRPNDELD